MSHKHSPHPLPSERYLNRETSWLAFNRRVLEEAQNSEHPLLERLNFLAISSSNLDEFFMVRVAGLKDYVRQRVATHSIDGLLPEQELSLVLENSSRLITQQYENWKNLRKALDDAGIRILGADDLGHKEHEWLREYFEHHLFPVLTPIAIDPAHPFPFLPNLGLAQVFRLSHEHRATKEQVVVLPIPANLARFIRLPGKKTRYVTIEDAIAQSLPVLCPGFTVVERLTLRIVRDSELDVEGDPENFVRNFERAIRQRRRGRVIRIKYAAPAPESLVNFVNQQLQIEPEDMFEVEGLLGLANLREIVSAGDAGLKFVPFQARFPERINDYEGNCFAAIAAKDIVVHHPFESFDVVVQFLRQAASDPNVVSIKQTLYRTGQDSPIVRALIEAAEAGKSVTALVELKARFDEEANIRLARELERAGAQVVYGFVSLKTHAKVTLVTRREEGNLVSYAHFGTGNYHPTTARIYTDLSFFTCDHALCTDAAYLFNFITGYAPPKAFKKLIVAPDSMRSRLLELIHDEVKHAKAGRPGNIWAKMNALVDAKIIDALYEASQAGVIIELVIRGICCLRPGVSGLSENIRVKSIVGRFLEHSRLFCFGAGKKLPHPDAKVFISSADWMPRNFDWRVEIAVPIENPTVHEQIMGQIMMANLKDEKQSWVLQPDGSYTRLKPTNTKFALSAQEYFMTNPSLSGRGKALQKARSTQMLKYKPVTKTK